MLFTLLHHPAEDEPRSSLERLHELRSVCLLAQDRKVQRQSREGGHGQLQQPLEAPAPDLEQVGPAATPALSPAGQSQHLRNERVHVLPTLPWRRVSLLPADWRVDGRPWSVDIGADLLGHKIQIRLA